MRLSKHDIEGLFERLNHELARRTITGEVYVVGGAVMCLVFDARASTRDVNAFFHPANEVRTAARTVAGAAGLPEDWLNDAVKGYLSHKNDFHRYLGPVQFAGAHRKPGVSARDEVSCHAPRRRIS